MRFQYKAWSLESRKPEVQKLLLFISASASVFSGLLEFEYSTQSGFWGYNYDAHTLFGLFFPLDLSPGRVCFETFDYLRMPHQLAFDPIL